MKLFPEQKIKKLKVLMVGGRRCGKTSALASMYEQIAHGPIKEIFTIRDSTIYEKNKINIDGKPEDQETLESKTLELQHYLETPPSGTFIADSSPTRCVWTYGLGMKIPGTKKEMIMEFLDCPGEFYQSGFRDEEVYSFVQQSDVCVVMVDTPYLMECNSSIVKGVNGILAIENYLTTFVATDNRSAKMVVFVPIKCEKWAKDGRMSEVIEAIKKSYDTLITGLVKNSHMHVAIIPIQTAGNMEFQEMKDAWVVVTSEMDENGNPVQIKKRCDKISEKMIRESGGKLRLRKNGEIVNIDMEAEIPGGAMKPNAWYKISEKKRQSVTNKKDGLYAPYNCEQLPLHILSFWFEKAKSCAPGGWKGKCISFFGGFSLEDMQERIDILQKAGSVKENVDGIEYINRPKF